MKEKPYEDLRCDEGNMSYIWCDHACLMERWWNVGGKLVESLWKVGGTLVENW